MTRPARYDAIGFDLLSALIDSSSLWNQVAGGQEAGQRWRRRYVDLTYGAGAYRPFEPLLAEAAAGVGLDPALAETLTARWDSLEPWPEAPDVLHRLAARGIALGIATNCSAALGRRAAERLGLPLTALVTAEEAGAYKPQPAAYRRMLQMLGTAPERTLFVAGSANCVPAARGAGMPAVWHNRIGAPVPASFAKAPPLAVLGNLEELEALLD